MGEPTMDINDVMWRRMCINMLLLLNGIHAHMVMHAKSILSTWGAHDVIKEGTKLITNVTNFM